MFWDLSHTIFKQLDLSPGRKWFVAQRVGAGRVSRAIAFTHSLIKPKELQLATFQTVMGEATWG